MGTWDLMVNAPALWPIPPAPYNNNFAPPAPPPPLGGAAGNKSHDRRLQIQNTPNGLAAIPDILALLLAETQYQFPILIRLINIDPEAVPAAYLGSYPWDTPPIVGGAAVNPPIFGIMFNNFVINDFT